MHANIRCAAILGLGWMTLVTIGSPGAGQTVGLPAPRLLTLMPMGGAAGSDLEVVIDGESLETAEQLIFATDLIEAEPVKDETGQLVPGRFQVHISPQCPPGAYDVRVWCGLGISTPRVFVVSRLDELLVIQPNQSPENAFSLPVGAVANATAPPKAVNYFATQLQGSEPVLIVCNAAGIESKLQPVVTVADSNGQDLRVERQKGWLVFEPPSAGRYLIKVHDLTFNGGPHYFYRLSIRPYHGGDPMELIPGVQPVHASSWPPADLGDATVEEIEPNNADDVAQQITPPCRIKGTFYPAADVDLFEFSATEGQQWWIEVASHRLGLITDPQVVVQHIAMEGDQAKREDVAELNDIPSPVKVSSNGYSYDGPPCNAGTNDVLGKIEISHSGTYQLRVSDLFGSTRSDPFVRYELVIRPPAPDFALVAWALHETMRNGDRNALSKPLALRAGAGTVLEVVVVRRDGFDGPVRLEVEGLPDGVEAVGTTIPAGQNRGVLAIAASSEATRGLGKIEIRGTAQIGSTEVSRPCRIASMQWPVRDAWQEIPVPRLQQTSWVSVSDSEPAPVTLEPGYERPPVVKAGETIKLPLRVIARCALSGSSVKLHGVGTGWEKFTTDLPLGKDVVELPIDTAALKLTPGKQRFALYGHLVMKYVPPEQLVEWAELEVESALKRQKEIEQRVAATTQPEEKERLQAELAAAGQVLQRAKQKLAQAKAQAKPRDIVDFVVSQPIEFMVQSKDQKDE